MKKRSTRILYVAGPGDVIGTYKHWSAGHDDPSQIAKTYSGQFYSLCREENIEALVISQHSRADQIIDGQFRIEHRPLGEQFARGIGYHRRQYRYLNGIAKSAIDFRADLIISSLDSHWTALYPALKRGIKLIPSLHCVLWPKSIRPTWANLFVRRLDAWSTRSACPAVLAASQDIVRQLDQFPESRGIPKYRFLPTYEREVFDAIEPAVFESAPFRILFVGRVEAEKGVFDLLEIRNQLIQQATRPFAIDVCGDGSALSELRRRVERSGASEEIQLHGYCRRPELQIHFSRSAVVVVPTRTDFVEGYNQVVAEAVLSGRPVVTSEVCPALGDVRGAAIEVRPNNITDYANSLAELMHSSTSYSSRRKQCREVGEKFFDPNHGWAETVRRAMTEQL